MYLCERSSGPSLVLVVFRLLNGSWVVLACRDQERLSEVCPYSECGVEV